MPQIVFTLRPLTQKEILDGESWTHRMQQAEEDEKLKATCAMQDIVDESVDVQVHFNENGDEKMLIVWEGAPINDPFRNHEEAISKLGMDPSIWEGYEFIQGAY
jgi:hypothetical protein